LEAVEQAQRLQPDLVLLDIGLPGLNGIEAARRIRTLSPLSKIVFVTQESSADVVQEALDLGASGYVVKADGGSQLVAAVSAGLRGEKFIGSRFARHDFIGASNLRTARAPSPSALPASSHPSLLRKAEVARHEALFYSDDESFLRGFAPFIETALKAGSAVLVFGSESRRESLLARLRERGLDMHAAIDQRRYMSFDSADVLSKFIVDDLPDPVRLNKLVAELVDTVPYGAGGVHTRLFACGELAPVLLRQGKAESAIRVEQLWDQLVKRYALDTLCGYPTTSFQSEQGRDVMQRICAQHSAVHSS